jgi:hypothetical protein
VLDTDETSERRYRELLRQAGPARRLEMCAQLTTAAREMALAGLRRERPEASAIEIRRALAARMYGAEVADRLPLGR